MKDNSNLKGTFFLVMVLGVLMIVSWFSIFGLYLSRQ
ncbi:MAG: cytochrome c oxidase subunit 2A [Clostridia bacterium]